MLGSIYAFDAEIGLYNIFDNLVAFYVLAIHTGMHAA